MSNVNSVGVYAKERYDYELMSWEEDQFILCQNCYNLGEMNPDEPQELWYQYRAANGVHCEVCGEVCND